MARRKCSRCGSTAEYLRRDHGWTCKACRQRHAPLLDRHVCWLAKACSQCGVVKPLSEYPRNRTRKDGRKAACTACTQQHRNRVLDSWYDAVRQGYTGNLEEYAEHHERLVMGCIGSDWERSRKAADLDRRARLRDKAEDLQRPMRDKVSGRLVWPPGWSRAERFSWLYDHDDLFRARQILRTKIRKYTDPAYAALAERKVSNKLKWKRAQDQLGTVTRRHIRREAKAKRCSYCLEPLTAENRQLDHIAPLSRGGQHDDSNIIASCSGCNLSKGRKPFLIWLIAKQNQKLPGSLANISLRGPERAASR